MATSQKPLPLQRDPGELTQSSMLGESAGGLTTTEAQQRLAQYGYNELPEKKVNPILKFLAYFWGPIAWMIEAAAMLSALSGTGKISDHHGAPVGNAVVGFWEEFQAGNAIAALKARLALRGTREARRRVDHRPRARTGPGGRDPAPPRGHHSGRCATSRWRSDRCRPVCLDGRIPSGDAQDR